MTGLAWTDLGISADEAARAAQALGRRTDPRNVERLVSAIRDVLHGEPGADVLLAVGLAAGGVWADMRGPRTEHDIGALAVVLQLAWDTRAKVALNG